MEDAVKLKIRLIYAIFAFEVGVDEFFEDKIELVFVQKFKQTLFFCG